MEVVRKEHWPPRPPRYPPRTVRWKTFCSIRTRWQFVLSGGKVGIGGKRSILAMDIVRLFTRSRLRIRARYRWIYPRDVIPNGARRHLANTEKICPPQARQAPTRVAIARLEMVRHLKVDRPRNRMTAIGTPIRNTHCLVATGGKLP